MPSLIFRYATAGGSNPDHWGSFSIRVEVSDDENATLQKSFSILAIDPLRDDDGDGLGYEAELIAGTNPNNPDGDGDGASDGSKYPQESTHWTLAYFPTVRLPI